MDTVLMAEDHAYTMREARKIDSNGLKRLHCQEIIDFRIKTAELNKAKAMLVPALSACLLEPQSDSERLGMDRITDSLYIT